MPLPDFDEKGELPAGVHTASLNEVVVRFGGGTPRRQEVTTRLLHIYELARATGKLGRFVVFGSYVTSKLDPNDVDIVLIMQDDFLLEECEERTGLLFYHDQAHETFGASVFWQRPSLLILETVDEFIQYWQITRDKTYRGIVEITP